MKYLKNIWAERVPNYNANYQHIFDKLANKGNEGGDNEERAKETGRVFATQYELYIYAFFSACTQTNSRKIQTKRISDTKFRNGERKIVNQDGNLLSKFKILSLFR